jgi:hypothetical protein
MGTRGLAVESFDHDSQKATSVVRASSTFRVTHEYAPSPETPNLYEAKVTIENTSDSTVDTRYRRVLDWDVPPRVFREYVTNNDGGSPSVSFMSDNGFASANPLAGPSSLRRTGDMTDFGPADQGALFDFELAALEPGKSTSFKIYYGAGPDEATVRGALEKVGAEAYSLGKPSSYRGKEEGIPNTFAFGFKREVASPQARSYVAIGDSTSTGHSIRICQRQGQPDASDFRYVYGCPVEPQDRSAYPDLLAEMLGSPYNDDYTVAESGDYRENPDLGPPGAHLNRVGVWASTIRQMVDNYERGIETGTDRRGDTPWESQLHAVDDAEILVTTLHGASDMRFADIPFWAQQISTFQTQEAANNLIDEINADRAGGKQSYMDAYFEVLDNAEERGAKVVIGLYYNPYHEPYASTVAGIPYRSNCGIMHGGARTITDTLNAELERRVNERQAAGKDFEVSDFKTKFNPPGDEDHGMGGPEPSQSWLYGSECNLDGAMSSFLPRSWSPGEGFDGGGEQVTAEMFDPHPNPEGSNAMAEEIKEVVAQ